MWIIVAVAVASVLWLGGCSAEDESLAAAPAAPEAPDGLDCSAEGLGEDDEVTFLVAHPVVDGELGQVCFGEEDQDLLAAWEDLSTITPPGQLSDLALFAGFAAADPSGEEETVAFVNAADDEGLSFQMSVNLDAYAAAPDEALLTLAHEFAHVFTQGPSQLDRSDAAFESCDTHLSSAGCFEPDSLIATWVDRFWTDEQLASLDPEQEPTVASGEERCAADPSFLGPYAASDPEEDFAESFSAFVFDVPAERPEVQEKLDWMAEQPGLVGFRDRAEAAGWTPLAHEFEPCG